MSNIIKIINGTQRDDDPSLCVTCENSIIWTDQRGEHIRCNASTFIDFTIAGKVTDCNRYEDKTKPTRRDYEKIAWVINADRHGKILGFIKPKKEED